MKILSAVDCVCQKTDPCCNVGKYVNCTRAS